MALSESDRDVDLFDQSETDDETLYRLATPTDNSEGGDNPSDGVEDDNNVDLPKIKKNKAKLSNRLKHVGKFRRNAIGRQALSGTKMGKLRKTGGKHKNGKENGQNDFSRSVSPGVHLDNTSGEENRRSYHSSHYRRGNDDAVTEIGPILCHKAEALGETFLIISPVMSGCPEPEDQNCPKRVRLFQKRQISNNSLVPRARI